MEFLNFENFYGNSEDAYSKVIAQTFVISKEFRKLFLNNINTKHSNRVIKKLSKEDLNSVVLENDFGVHGRIDILFELENGVYIAIENKKWAGLQQNQLGRYCVALEYLEVPYILVFLSPKNYFLGDNDKPKNLLRGVFVDINYSEVLSICLKIFNKSKNDLEKNYFKSLINFLGGITLKPITSDEIYSLMSYHDARQKIVSILSDVKNENEPLENNSNFLLSNRNINSYTCYFGFRFGTKWYYNAPLLMNQPEMIFYIKDLENDAKKARIQNKILKELHNRLKDDIAEKYQCSVDFYKRKKKNECRLAIRKSLSDFKSKDLSKPVQWLTRILEEMEQLL